jgi:acyl carrier protein
MSTKILQDISGGIQLEAVINDYVSKEFVQDPGRLPLGNTIPLLETGILDSLNLLRLVLFIQERFGIVVDDLDVICAYLRFRVECSAVQAVGHG